MSDLELRDEMVTLLFAGHETTTTSMSWAIYRVLSDPAVAIRIQSELEKVVGTARGGRRVDREARVPRCGDQGEPPAGPGDSR